MCTSVLSRNALAWATVALAAACQASTNPAGHAPGGAVQDGPVVPALGPLTPEDAAIRLIGRIFVKDRAMADLRHLTDQIGPRPAGSDADRRAVFWAMRRFGDMGLEARLETFTVAQGWKRGPIAARIVTPREHPLRVSSAGGSPATPGGAVRGAVVELPYATPHLIRSRASELRGRMVLLDPRWLFQDGFTSGTTRLSRAYEPLRDVGAVAVLWPWRPRDGQFKGHLTFYARGPIAPLPVVDVTREDAALLRHLMTEGPVELELSVENHVTGPFETGNVVAEIRGREKPDEWVLVGAHLDTWDVTPGAQDNGTGVVQVLEAARAIKALPTPPRRSIRFVLWGAEELDLLGSRAYVAAHDAELDDCVAVLNADDGAGEPRGWQVIGREDVAAALEARVAGLLGGLGGGARSLEVTGNSDHAPFWLRGVPALNLWVDTSEYLAVHHLPGDTVDKIAPHRVVRAAAIVAVTAWILADSPERLAPRFPVAEMESLLREHGLLEIYRELGEFP